MGGSTGRGTGTGPGKLIRVCGQCHWGRVRVRVRVMVRFRQYWGRGR